MTTVAEIMQTDVITVRRDASVREIAQTLVREGISGVPVIDDDGGVLGVVSASDIVRTAARDAEVELAFELRRSPTHGRADDDDAEELGRPELLPEWVEPVLLGDQLDGLDAADIMTPASFSVRPDVELSEFAEFLVRGRIHRALVLDEGRLAGIATSFDALRALTEAHAEAGRGAT